MNQQIQSLDVISQNHMMQSGTWMAEGYGRGYHGSMFGNHFGGGFDGFGPVSLFTISVLSILFFLALLWTIAIKGYALWHAAKRNEKWWFVALLVINTFGILELIYLFFFAKVFGRGEKKTEAGSVESKPAESSVGKDHKDAHEPHVHGHENGHDHKDSAEVK